MLNIIVPKDDVTQLLKMIYEYNVTAISIKNSNARFVDDSISSTNNYRELMIQFRYNDESKCFDHIRFTTLFKMKIL